MRERSKKEKENEPQWNELRTSIDGFKKEWLVQSWRLKELGDLK